MLLRMSLLLAASLLGAWAQTPNSFQNCQAGDQVRVKCTQPLLVLGKATLLEIGSNTVTVCTASDRFTLDQTNVTLLPLALRAAPTAPEPAPGSSGAGNSPGQTPAVPAANSQTGTAMALAPAKAESPMNIAQAMESIRASVLDPHKAGATQAQSDNANAYYNKTMTGVLNGNVTQSDLVREAKKMLTECDKYDPERKKDPQYEKEIEILREFVRRSEAGETFQFSQPGQ